MALLRGKLLAGALFAGALFGPQGEVAEAPHPNLVAYLGGAGKTVQPATKPFSTTYEDVVEQAPASTVINDDEEVVRLVAIMIGELL